MREQALEYTLVKNHLDNNEGFMAKVIHQKGLSFEELLKEMEKNTAIRSQDLRLAMAQLEKVILENTARGLKVATPFGTFKATVRGSFASLHEEFRPNHPGINHRVKLHFTPARRFTKKLTEEIAVRKLLEHRLPHPHVAKVINRSAPPPSGSAGRRPGAVRHQPQGRSRCRRRGGLPGERHRRRLSRGAHPPEYQIPADLPGTAPGAGGVHPESGGAAAESRLADRRGRGEAPGRPLGDHFPFSDDTSGTDEACSFGIQILTDTSSTCFCNVPRPRTRLNMAHVRREPRPCSHRYRPLYSTNIALCSGVQGRGTPLTRAWFQSRPHTVDRHRHFPPISFTIFLKPKRPCLL